MFLFLDNLHKLSWFTFVWEDTMNVGFVLLLLLAVVAAMVAQKPREKLKDIVTLYPGFSNVLQKTLFLFTLRLGYVFLIVVFLLKLFLFCSYYIHIDAVYYYSLFIRSSTNLMWLRIDFATQLITFVISLVTLVFINNSVTLFRSKPVGFPFPFEFAPLVFLLMLGLRVTIFSNDLVLVILALEIVSFCLIVFLSWQFTLVTAAGKAAIEAAIKYYLINALSVGVMLFGMALLYFVYGTTNLLLIEGFSLVVPTVDVVFNEASALAGVVFLIGFLIKIGAAPFHLWVADVYDGTDFLVTSLLLGLISPVFLAKFLLVTKTLTDLSEGVSGGIHNIFFVFTVVGCLSVFFGTFGAIFQWRLKRLLAFASITHLGFILLALGCNSLLGFCACWGYLFLYVIMVNLVCSVLLWFRSYCPQAHFTYLNGLSMLRHTGGYGVFILITVFFSFAGIPPLGGFFTKFAVLMALVEAKSYLIVAFLIVVIVIDAYLYLRLIRFMLFDEVTPRVVQYAGSSYMKLIQRYSVPSSVVKFDGRGEFQPAFFFFWTLCASFFLIVFVFFVPSFGVNFIYFVRDLVWFA